MIFLVMFRTSLQPHEVADGKSCRSYRAGHTHQPCPEFTLIHGQVTGHFSGLAVDAEGEFLPVPVCVQDPHRVQGISCLAVLQIDGRINREYFMEKVYSKEYGKEVN